MRASGGRGRGSESGPDFFNDAIAEEDELSDNDEFHDADNEHHDAEPNDEIISIDSDEEDQDEYEESFINDGTIHIQ